MDKNKPILQESFGKKKVIDDLNKNNWWDCDDSQLHHQINSTVNMIENAQSNRDIMYSKFERLYGNLELKSYLTGNKANSTLSNRVTFNIVKSVIDTVASKIAKNKPRISFLTEEGNFSLQERAKKLSKYVEGVFYDQDLYEKAQKMFISACVYGTGVLKVYTEDSKIKIENVFIHELRVDEVEGLYGEPRQMHQTKFIDRAVLISQFPDKKDLILEANPAEVERGGKTYTADMIKVTESWHLPSSSSSNDGKHAITIENGLLLKEDYIKSYFPFIIFRWDNRLAGWHGEGLAEQLIGIQIEINKLLKNIQKAQHLIAVPRVAIDQSSKISASTVTNEIGAIFKYAGKAPNFFTPQAMNAEVYNHLKWLINSAYEVSGVSQLSATGKKPAGLDAAVAIREVQDIETERFAIVAQRYEQVFLNLAEVIIDVSRDMYKDNKQLKVKVQSSKFIETIDWKDVDLDDSKFVLKLWPVSLLPNSPAGKLQKVQELLQAGLIPQEMALSLLDFPDLDKAQSLELASLKLAEKQLSMIIEKGEYTSPEPQQGLELAKKLAQQEYLRQKLNNLPEDRLELLLRYIDDVERLIKQAQAPAEQAPAPEAMPPAPEASPIVAEPGTMPVAGQPVV